MTSFFTLSFKLVSISEYMNVNGYIIVNLLITMLVKLSVAVID